MTSTRSLPTWLRTEDATSPNDHVNASQSSNDTFPSALTSRGGPERHGAGAASGRRLAGKPSGGWRSLSRPDPHWPDPLQDATPLGKFAQEVSGWRGWWGPCRMLRRPAGADQTGHRRHRRGHRPQRPKGYDEMVCGRLRAMTGVDFTPDTNKFHALTSKDAWCSPHGAR